MDAALADNRVVALAGMAGVGKTALAIEYAHRHAAEFDVVWWMPATRDDLIGHYRAALTYALHMYRGTPWTEVAAELDRRGRWLMILDGAETPDTVAGFDPSGRGRLVVTSHRSGWEAWGRTVEVPALRRSESVELLTGRIPGLEVVVAAGIAGRLGDVALAVEQAAGFLDQTAMPADYLALLDDRLGQLTGGGEVIDRPQETVATLWALAVGRLAAERPAAVELLELLSLCESEPVPLDLFTATPDALGDTALGRAALGRAAGDASEWNLTVGALTGLNLIRREGDSMSVHRLIQAAARERLPDQRYTAVQSTMLRLLRAYLPGKIDVNPAGWPRWRTLLPHLRPALGWRGQPTTATASDAAWLYAKAGSYLENHGHDAASVPYLEEALEINRATHGGDHPSTLTSQHNLARAYEDVGRVTEATALFETTLAARERLFGADHPSASSPRDHLAWTYKEVGRLTEAVTLFETTLAARERVSCADHPRTSDARDHLAYAYQAAGRAAEAIGLLETTLTGHERVSGPDHPSTLRSRDRLGAVYERAGRVAEAITLYEVTVTARERTMGADVGPAHRWRDRLAGAYETVGRRAEAITLYEATLAQQERVLRPDSLSVVISREKLAIAYEAAGRITEAITLYEVVLAQWERVLGADDEFTLGSRDRLAAAYETAGRLTEARRLADQDPGAGGT